MWIWEKAGVGWGGWTQAHQNIEPGNGKLWGWISAWWSSHDGTRSSGVGAVSSGVGNWIQKGFNRYSPHPTPKLHLKYKYKMGF